MITEEIILKFEAALHDALVDAGHRNVSITRVMIGNQNGYVVEASSGHATFLVSYQTGNFMRVLDMPPGYGV